MAHANQARPADASPREPYRIGFLLVPGFALMSFASATEPFRAANLLAGRELYRLSFFGETGPGEAGFGQLNPAGLGSGGREGMVAASSGALMPVDPLPAGPLPEGGTQDAVFVCAGGSPSAWERPAIHACLRRLASEGVRLGGISGGPYLLAAAGLLAGRRFTVHWEHAPALAEAFPELTPVPARFVIDGDRLTCGGGVAPLDMMHALIAERMGEAFARRVSDWFLHTEVGAPQAPQRASVAERYRIHHPALVRVLERMAETVEAPLPRSAMARLAGVSPRHLDRLFARHMGSTFSAEYRALRLDHAMRLLRQSALPIAEIAFATGFSSAGHMTRQFRARFGTTPSAARQAPA